MGTRSSGEAHSVTGLQKSMPDADKAQIAIMLGSCTSFGMQTDSRSPKKTLKRVAPADETPSSLEGKGRHRNRPSKCDLIGNSTRPSGFTEQY